MAASGETRRSGQGNDNERGKASFLSFILSFIHFIPFFRRPSFSSSLALVRPVKLFFFNAGIKVGSGVGVWIIKKKKKLCSLSEITTSVGRRVLIVKRLGAREGVESLVVVLAWFFEVKGEMHEPLLHSDVMIAYLSARIVCS